MNRHTYGKARNGNENGNWKLETGNWKLETELETEIEMQSPSCCSPIVRFMYCWLLFLAPASVFDCLPC